jgi:hypothetical protein
MIPGAKRLWRELTSAENLLDLGIVLVMAASLIGAVFILISSHLA